MNSKDVLLERAVAILNALKVPYAILKDDGTKLGALEVKTEKPKKVRNPRPDIKQFYGPKVLPMQPGDVVRIDIPEQFDVESFRGPVAAFCGQRWGKGSYVTAVKRDTRTVDVMRIK